MADTDNLPNADGLSDILAKITQNKELMAAISGIVGGEPSPSAPPNTETPVETGLQSALANPDLMAKLPEVMAMLGPMLSGGAPKAPPKKDSHADAAGRRIALLYALKPYLSPRRCEAVDYFARMSKMGDLMKNLKF